MARRSKRSRPAATLLLSLVLLAGCAPVRGLAEPKAGKAAEPKVTTIPLPPARIVFFGDSITEGGARPDGYVTLVGQALKRRYPGRKLQVIAEGVSGDKVTDLQERLEDDVLSKKPTHVVILIGVNDVGSTASSVAQQEKLTFQQGLHDLVIRIKGSGAEVILCTPSVIGENIASASRQNRLLDEFALISREVAAQYGAGACDIRTAFIEYLKTHNARDRYRGILTYDGLHLNKRGNRFLAQQMLKALDAHFPRPPVV